MKRHLGERLRLFTKGHPAWVFIQENILIANHHLSIIHFIYLSIYGVSILFMLDFPIEINFICFRWHKFAKRNIIFTCLMAPLAKLLKIVACNMAQVYMNIFTTGSMKTIILVNECPKYGVSTKNLFNIWDILVNRWETYCIPLNCLPHSLNPKYSSDE